MLKQWISSFCFRLRALWKGRQLDRDLQDEMTFHLAMREQKLKASGAVANEAPYSARRVFGNLTLLAEDTRAVWRFTWLDHFGQDLRYSIRSLRKSPVLAAVIVLSLALGIGANTAIFSLMNSIMLRLLPVQKPEQLVSILRQEPGWRADEDFTNALWEAFRNQQDVFTNVFAWSTPQFDLAQGGAVRHVNGAFVSADYFNTLGVTPAAGRLIAATDDHRGCAPVAVLSYGFWQAHFGGNESALGSSISVDGQPAEIIGVSPPRFYGVEVGKNFDVALPLCASALFDQRNLDSRGRWWLRIMGRLKPGITSEQLRARLELLSPTVARAAVPDDWEAADQQRFLAAQLIAIPAATGRSNLRQAFAAPLTLLMAMVAIVLLIACANIASLLLARAKARGKEMAIRKALGASRGRLIRQLLTESLLLSSLGASLGLLFARWASTLLVRSLSTGGAPIYVDLSLDSRVLAFTAALALLTGVLVGLLPAAGSSRVGVITAMQPRAVAGTETPSRRWLGNWIVAGQVALSLVLLIGGGLLLRTFSNLVTLDLGFDRSSVLIVTTKPPWWAADTEKVPPAQRTALYHEICRRLRSIPGVVSVSRSFIEPMGGDNWVNHIQPVDAAWRGDEQSGPPLPSVDAWPQRPAGASQQKAAEPHQHAPTGEQATAYFNFVSPGYFKTLGTPVLAGRDFDDDDRSNSLPVAIINETLARKFFPGMNPLGRHFRQERRPGKPSPLVQIVGIVKDSKYETVRQVIPPTVFLPVTQMPADTEAEDIELRTSVPPSSLIPTAQRVIAGVNKSVPMEFHTLAAQVADDLVQERLLATLAGFFAALALLLAVIGLYGVLSYLVTQRQSEFGIRMALGARRATIFQLVMTDVALILSVGAGAGVCISLLAGRFLQHLLFGVTPHDFGTYIIAVLALSAVAVIAAYLPARRAASADPLTALRYE